MEMARSGPLMHLDDEPHMAKQLLTANARHPFCETLNRVMPRKVLKLTAEDREILDRIARMPNDEVLRLRFEEISAYLRSSTRSTPTLFAKLSKRCAWAWASRTQTSDAGRNA